MYSDQLASKMGETFDRILEQRKIRRLYSAEEVEDRGAYGAPLNLRYETRLQAMISSPVEWPPSDTERSRQGLWGCGTYAGPILVPYRSSHPDQAAEDSL